MHRYRPRDRIGRREMLGPYATQISLSRRSQTVSTGSSAVCVLWRTGRVVAETVAESWSEARRGPRRTVRCVRRRQSDCARRRSNAAVDRPSILAEFLSDDNADTQRQISELTRTIQEQPCSRPGHHRAPMTGRAVRLEGTISRMSVPRKMRDGA